MTDTVIGTPFWRAILVRAVRTFCQTILAMAAGNFTNLLSIGWQQVLITAAGAAFLSLVMGVVAGLPEVPLPDK